MNKPEKLPYSSEHYPLGGSRRQEATGQASRHGMRSLSSKFLGHSGGILWMTGLPGSGKTTLSTHLNEELRNRGYRTFVLDGDILRRTLNSEHTRQALEA